MLFQRVCVALLLDKLSLKPVNHAFAVMFSRTMTYQGINNAHKQNLQPKIRMRYRVSITNIFFSCFDSCHTGELSLTEQNSCILCKMICQSYVVVVLLLFFCLSMTGFDSFYDYPVFMFMIIL